MSILKLWKLLGMILRGWEQSALALGFAVPFVGGRCISNPVEYLPCLLREVRHSSFSVKAISHF